MPSRIKIALVAALLLVCVIVLALGTHPLKGYTAGHPTWFESVRDIEQMVVHFPGLLMAAGLLHLRVDFLPLALLIVFLTGYFETALLIGSGIWLFRILSDSIRTIYSRS